MQGGLMAAGDAVILMSHYDFYGKRRVMGLVIGPSEFCHQVPFIQFMGQGKFIFLTGDSVLDPYLSGGYITISLPVSAIKKFLVYILPDFISIDYPDIKTVLLTIITSIYFRDFLF